MTADRILVRYGEITVKGRNRGKFEKRMVEEIKKALRPFPDVKFENSYGRLYMILNGEPYEPIAARLKEVFGIASFSPVTKAESELEAIRDAALQVMRSLPEEPATFKVNARRVLKSFPYGSQEMNHLVGSHVLRAMPALKVNVREPEVELHVEIRAEGTYVYSETVQGAGGFPYGTNGKGLLLLSGGIDSPVAGYLAMRKGLEIEAVHFHSYPFTSDKAKEKVIDLARRLSYYSGKPIKLHLVSFTEIQTELAKSDQDHLIITLMRRSMLRIAERLAEKAGALGLVTGDSLGQVASQTLSSMNVIGRTVDLPLLRPLIMMDKNDIIRIAERIGTFETSILPYEDCCTLFVPKSPSTNPNLNVVQKVESVVPRLQEMIDEAVETVETIFVSEKHEKADQPAGSDDWF